jgi:exodeoxyribonuclease V alpha subunit
MLQRNLLYTAITRGKKLVILVGQKRAVEISVTQKNEVKRYSSLKKRLLEAPSA